MNNIKKASLEDLRNMAEAGKLYHDPKAPTDVEDLGVDFWNDAEILRPKDKLRSVHLKLEPEVFEFFKQQGKGHLTKMQKILTAYALAHGLT